MTEDRISPYAQDRSGSEFLDQLDSVHPSLGDWAREQLRAKKAPTVGILKQRLRAAMDLGDARRRETVEDRVSSMATMAVHIQTRLLRAASQRYMSKNVAEMIAEMARSIATTAAELAADIDKMEGS